MCVHSSGGGGGGGGGVDPLTDPGLSPGIKSNFPSLLLGLDTNPFADNTSPPPIVLAQN